jgi:hypothetical protein
MRDQVVGEVEHSQFTQMADVFNLCDLVRMQIQYIQLGQILEISYALDVVLAEHEHAQSWHRVQM